ncbi:hypothetical protein LPJ81_006180 [Coemansia sp. IMI 209127]|nr:hypothetical protein LPJ81_006180 [Coemansia sp. IMI 209127]
MFDDEDDAPAKEETASNKPSDSGVASPTEQDDSDVEMMDDSDNNMDSQEPAVAETKAALSDDSSNAAQNNGRRRVRKRRKVSKVKHTKNKRGMLVSQVVDEWESYSESEPDDAHGSSATFVKKEASHEPGASADESKQRSAGKKTKSGAPQRSILSFFGKK